MLKRDELNDQNSCLNNSEDDEPIFVLKSTDVSAPDTVRRWAVEYKERKGGLLNMSPKQFAKYREALQTANDMEDWFMTREI